MAMADETKMIIMEQARTVSMDEVGIYKIPTISLVRKFWEIKSDK